MRDQLRLDAARYGLKATIGGRSVKDVAKEVVAISRAGLARRSRAGAMAVDETHFLDPLERIAESGVAMGDYIVQRYLEDLKGDTRRLLAEISF
jgi:glutamate--cysteine ligase